MENISSVLHKAKKYLINNAIKSANIDSEILMCSVLKKSREHLIINILDKIDDDKINIFNQLVERRKKREPIAYILKKKDFWKSTFYVDKNVLIPRPDTEILIEEILNNYNKNEKLSVLDIGTGSGCIIISILKDRQNFKGTAIDICRNALNVAKKGHQYFDCIGTVIVDELHVMGTEKLSEAFSYVQPRYLIGLSATPYRSDGMDSLLEAYFGKDKIYRKLHHQHHF